MLCATTSIWVAPVAASSSSIQPEMAAALSTLQPHLGSATVCAARDARGQRSASKGGSIGWKSAAEPLMPWMNRIGTWPAGASVTVVASTDADASVAVDAESLPAHAPSAINMTAAVRIHIPTYEV